MSDGPTKSKDFYVGLDYTPTPPEPMVLDSEGRQMSDEIDCIVSGFRHDPDGVTITLTHSVLGISEQATGLNYRIAYMKAWDLLKEKVEHERN